MYTPCHSGTRVDNSSNAVEHDEAREDGAEDLDEVHDTELQRTWEAAHEADTWINNHII